MAVSPGFATKSSPRCRHQAASKVLGRDCSSACSTPSPTSSPLPIPSCTGLSLCLLVMVVSQPLPSGDPKNRPQTRRRLPMIPVGILHPGIDTALTRCIDKGLFEEGGIKAFSIINVWSVTSIIALAEVMFFNSIRRPTVGISQSLGDAFLL